MGMGLSLLGSSCHGRAKRSGGAYGVPFLRWLNSTLCLTALWVMPPIGESQTPFSSHLHPPLFTHLLGYTRLTLRGLLGGMLVVLLVSTRETHGAVVRRDVTR